MKVLLLIILAPIFYYSVFTFNAYKKFPQNLISTSVKKDQEISQEQIKYLTCSMSDESGYTGNMSMSGTITRMIYFDSKSLGSIENDIFSKIKFFLLKKYVVEKRIVAHDRAVLFSTLIKIGSRYGKDISGLNMASRAYLSKSLKFLNPLEFFQLMAMMRSIDDYHIVKQADANLKMANKIKSSCLK